MEKIQTNRLKLAQLRYFDEKRNATEIPQKKGYAFLVENNGEYVNILNLENSLPVYGRCLYTNTTMDGEDYGTKIFLVSGEVKSGLCFVMEPVNVSQIFQCSEVSLKDLEQYILNSDLFFIDRLELLKNKKIPFYMKKSLKKRICEDMSCLNELNEYFASQEENIQYQK